MVKQTTSSKKWMAFMLLVCGFVQTVEAQHVWKLGANMGGAFSIIPKISSDTLISSAGAYASPRVSFGFQPELEFFLQPSWRRLAHSEMRSDVLYRRDYVEAALGFEFRPTWLNQSSLEGGFNYCHLLRSQIRTEIAGASGNYRYENKTEIDKRFLDAFIGLNLRLSNRLGIHAAYHFSDLPVATASEIRGRPSQLVLGLKIDLLDNKDKHPIDTQKETNSTVRKEIIEFKERGVLLVQRIPYQKRTEFGDEAAWQRMLMRTDSANLWLEQAFKEHYTFSKVQFFESSEIDALVARNWAETSISFEPGKEPPYMVALVGSYFYEYNRNVNSGLFIYDANMQFRKLPFPGFSSFRSFAQFFYNREELVRMVVWFDKAIKRYEAATASRS